MAALSDEKIVAYVDGELDAAECARIEALAARDPDIRLRIEMFRRTARAILQPTHDAVLNAKVPDFLLDTVATAALGDRSKTLGHQTGAARVLPFRRPVRWQAPLAYAASIALAIGWLGYAKLIPSGQILVQDGGRMMASGVLASALESSPSTSILASGRLQQAAEVTPYLTYKDKQNQFCREYEVTLASGSTFAGLGCRVGEGQWQIQAHLPAAPRRKPSTTSPAMGPPALLSMIEATSEGDALDAKQESAAIGKGWRR